MRIALPVSIVAVINLLHWVLAFINPESYKKSFPWFRIYAGTLAWTYLVAIILTIVKPKASGIAS
jgi:hypothetical protein